MRAESFICFPLLTERFSKAFYANSEQVEKNFNYIETLSNSLNSFTFIQYNTFMVLFNIIKNYRATLMWNCWIFINTQGKIYSNSVSCFLHQLNELMKLVWIESFRKFFRKSNVVLNVVFKTRTKIFVKLLHDWYMRSYLETTSS